MAGQVPLMDALSFPLGKIFGKAGEGPPDLFFRKTAIYQGQLLFDNRPTVSVASDNLLLDVTRAGQNRPHTA